MSVRLAAPGTVNDKVTETYRDKATHITSRYRVNTWGYDYSQSGKKPNVNHHLGPIQWSPIW